MMMKNKIFFNKKKKIKLKEIKEKMNDLFLFQISIITLSNESFNILIIIHLTEIKQIFDCFLKINSFIIGIKKIKIKLT